MSVPPEAGIIASCRLPGLLRGFFYGLIGFLVIMGLGGFLLAASRDANFPRLVLVGWVAVLAWVCYNFLRIPHTIELRADNALVLKSALRTVALPVGEVGSVKAMPLALGYAKLRSSRGSFILITQMTGFYEILWRLKGLNPGLEIEGC